MRTHRSTTRTTFLSSLVCRIGFCAVLLTAHVAIAAEAAITGRVKSAASGVYLRNARVAVEGTAIETLTNEAGDFLIPGLPAGNYRLHASYTGMTPESVAVSSADAGAVEVALQPFGQKAAAAGEVVKLGAFRVSTSREMSAADMAINEKRITRNIKDVIATDC